MLQVTNIAAYSLHQFNQSINQLTFPVFKTHQGESTDNNWEIAHQQGLDSAHVMPV